MYILFIMSYLQFLVDYASGMAENVWLDFYITIYGSIPISRIPFN